MNISNVRDVKQYWNGDYDLTADFDVDGYKFSGYFYLNTTDPAPASVKLREMIANKEYTGDVTFVKEPTEEEINTMRAQLKAQLDGNQQ